MAFENLNERLRTVMNSPLDPIRAHPLILDLFESAYFVAALTFLSIGMNGSLRDFTEQPEIERRPWVPEFAGTISQFGFEFYFWATFVLFFRFLIQRRWLELSSPITFLALAGIRFIVSGFTSPYLCDLAETILLLLLNSALLVKTIYRIFSGLKARARDQRS